MTHIYHVTGMTCNNCEMKVKSLLEKVPGVQAVTMQLKEEKATIEMDRHITTDQLKHALEDHPYQISEISNGVPAANFQLQEEEKKSWWDTYKPVLLIFLYITGVTLLIELLQSQWDWMRWMNHFMAGFFLVFSFFKLLNLRGFAESYFSYDVIAKRWIGWGYLYAFIELGLGLAFLTGVFPVATNLVTFILMTISIIGVLQSLFNKRKIKCACLGDVFNLPMSTITVTEDALMILISGAMLLMLLL